MPTYVTTKHTYTRIIRDYFKYVILILVEKKKTVVYNYDGRNVVMDS